MPNSEAVEKVIELVCEVCSEPMNFTGEIVREYPRDKYVHRCVKCGHLQLAFDIYPKYQNVEAK